MNKQALDATTRKRKPILHTVTDGPEPLYFLQDSLTI